MSYCMMYSTDLPTARSQEFPIGSAHHVDPTMGTNFAGLSFVEDGDDNQRRKTRTKLASGVDAIIPDVLRCEVVVGYIATLEFSFGATKATKYNYTTKSLLNVWCGARLLKIPIFHNPSTLPC
jgi:hypothetical protein